MRFNEDKRIKIPVPFLQDKTILYEDSRIEISHFYIEENRYDLPEVSRFWATHSFFCPMRAGMFCTTCFPVRTIFSWLRTCLRAFRVIMDPENDYEGCLRD